METHGCSTRMHTFPSGCGDAQRSPGKTFTGRSTCWQSRNRRHRSRSHVRNRQQTSYSSVRIAAPDTSITVTGGRLTCVPAFRGFKSIAATDLAMVIPYSPTAALVVAVIMAAVIVIAALVATHAAIPV